MVRATIVTCPAWRAHPPRQGIRTVGKASRIIFHHTAGHHAEIANPRDESLQEAMRYARDLQAFHMARPPHGRGWIDSGHNFLVCRNGTIIQGRWLTVSAIEAGHMVESAHCPGQNEQIGIEHEHDGTEKITPAQGRASARLMAWIADQYGRDTVLRVDPHSAHYATECPGNLRSAIPSIVRTAQQILDSEGGGSR